jgi:uncharacterized protein
MNPEARFSCPKCHHPEYEVKELSTTGGWISRIFDFQSNRFSAVICSNCRYAELYAVKKSGLHNVLDIISSG